MFNKVTKFALSWQQAAVNRRVITAALTVATATFLFKLMVALREIAVAYTFGTSDSIDAFIVAFIAPSFAINIQIAAITAALMPVYIRLRDRDGAAAADRLAQNAMFAVCFMLILTILLLFFAAEPIVHLLGSGFETPKQDLTLRLFYLLLPIVLLQGMIKCLGTFINAGRRFAVVAAAPLATPVLTVLLLLTVPQAGIDLLVIGVIGGSAFELVILILQTRRLRLPLRPRWHGFDAPTRLVVGQYLPTMLGALTGGAALLVDQSMAAMLGPGSVASLNYGSKLIATILTLSATPLSTAILPYLSQLASANDAPRIRQSLIGWVSLAFALGLPLAVVMYIASEPIIRLFYERGAFTAQDTMLVGQVQAFYALQIPFYLVGVLAARVLNAMSLNHITAVIGIMNLTTNIVFNLLFMKWFGLPGIALSTAFVYFCSSIVLLTIVCSRLNRMRADAAEVTNAA